MIIMNKNKVLFLLLAHLCVLSDLGRNLKVLPFGNTGRYCHRLLL